MKSYSVMEQLVGVTRFTFSLSFKVDFKAAQILSLQVLEENDLTRKSSKQMRT